MGSMNPVTQKVCKSKSYIMHYCTYYFSFDVSSKNYSHISGEIQLVDCGWNFFPWNVWNKQKINTINTDAKVHTSHPKKPISTSSTLAKLDRIGKQRFGNQKEIIDLEETVCLPRYQCGRNQRISFEEKSFQIPFTDLLNEQTVSIAFTTSIQGVPERSIRYALYF